MKRILCLRFPAWPLQRLIAARRELRKRAVLIVKRSARGGEIVYLASALARQQGVRLGMPVAEAVACFPDEQSVHLAVDDPKTDLHWLARIAGWCERYSPLVGWQTVSKLPPSGDRPTALYLDIQGIGLLFGGEGALVQEMLGEIEKRGFVPRIGVADTVGAAWAITHGVNQPVSLLPRGRASEVLASLPITTLRLSEGTVDKLHSLGVTTIAQLGELPRQGLSARFGESLLLRLDQALGDAEELIQPHKPLPEFQTEWVLEHPSARRDELELILTELVKRLAAQLWERQRGAVQLACRLDAAGEGPTCFTVGLYRPTAAAGHLLELLLIQLEQLRIYQAIGRVNLAAPLTSPLKLRQGYLFDGESHRSAEALSLLLDRLSSRLGVQAVLQPRLRSDALPERTIELIPAVNHAAKKCGPLAPHDQALSHRPLVLLAQPIELEVTAIAPDGPPLRFRHGHHLHRVARYWGPERIESGWWRQQRCVRRDYYRVETATGTRFWLYRELQQGSWFLHGVFE
jgi:protein ImuB